MTSPESPMESPAESPVGRRAALGREVRLVDVAADAGVAPSTVSRAFRNPDRVNPATLAVIRESAERLGYVHRPYRRRIGKTAGVISLVVKDTAASSSLLRGAQDEAYASGLAISVIESNRTGQWETSFTEEISETSRGVLIASDRVDAPRLAKLARRVPLVALNRPVHGVSSVVPYAFSGVHQALALLMSNRHSEVVYVSGPDSWADRSRWHAVESVAKSRGMAVRRVGPFESSAEGGGQAARMLQGPSCPSAVISYNDVIAAGMIAQFARDGVNVPGDVSLITFDDSPLASMMMPPLTSIVIPRERIGAIGVRTLLRMNSMGLYSLSSFGVDDLAALHLDASTVRSFEDPDMLALPTSLIIRESVGPARR